MTEAEWLAATDPMPMLACLERKATDRKLRLFGSACCRNAVVRTGSLNFTDGHMDVLERHADGAATAEELRAVPIPMGGYEVAGTYLLGRNVIHGARESVRWMTGRRRNIGGGLFHDFPDELPVAIALIRCVFGNPFRPVSPDPTWRTSTALAEGIYSDRAFDRLPILADALQDAGCDHADVLDHCRNPGPHARGCWVVDLALGKS